MSAEDASVTRLAKAERMADEIVNIADDASSDVVTKTDAKGDDKHSLNRDSIARAKLRIDTRMWLMARLAPQVYGNAAPKAVETNPPVSFEIHTTPEPDDDEESADDTT
jgi:hypothetical protein